MVPQRVVLCLLLLPMLAVCVPQDVLLPHGPGIDTELPRQYGVSSPEITLQVPIVFYGEVYYTVWVNSNGLLSFLTDIPNFFNIQFPLDYPVIAPLYTNVDTSVSGSVFYRESQDPELLENMTEKIQRTFSFAQGFQAQSVFITTWKDVGYHKEGSDKLNTYQVAVASDGTDSYVDFLYVDGGIQWIQGSSQESGLPDARAQSGFVSGDGRFYTLRGSGTDQIQNLDKWSNIGVPGDWMFHIGQTGPSENVNVPDIEIGSAELEGQTCAEQGVTVCHSKANCFDTETSFCCSCIPGYYGNGINCLKEGVPVRVNGKINGKLNDVEINNLDMQSYVVTPDGRTYTAVSRVPSDLGYDLQTLSTLGSIIGWLFAKPLNQAVNGYQVTGGVFNYSAEINFPSTGNKVTIKQRFLGLDVFDQLKLEAEIFGSLPTVPHGSKIQIPEFEDEFTRIKPGIIRSLSSQAFRLENVPVDNPFTVEQLIEYTECSLSNQNLTTLKVKVGRSFIAYETRENIIRYGMTSKVLPLGDNDPCKDAQCGPFSSCIVEGDGHLCVCNPGYQYLYSEIDGKEVAECVDINECSTGTHTCSHNAVCYNNPGSFVCQCNPGFKGNGHVCQKLLTCEDLNCHPDAECLTNIAGGVHCACKAGYSGNGQDCTSISLYATTLPVTCDIANNCSPYGVCAYDSLLGIYSCQCLDGYFGDGYSCVDADLINATDSEPSPICVLGTCMCPADYEFINERCVYKDDYFETTQSGVSCYTINNCHPYAQCIYSPAKGYHCQCNAGFEGDGYECTETETSCLDSPTCDAHASCIYDHILDKYRCKCNPGFQGDGTSCTSIDECTGHQECGDHGYCAWNSHLSKYECKCQDGYTWRENRCQPETGNTGCRLTNDCHSNAQCLYDSVEGNFKCVCNAGFSGDGKTCSSDPIGCNILNNCGAGAECTYDQTAGGYRCKCKQGLRGDGFYCEPESSCLQNPKLCGRDASCVRTSQGSYSCQCNEGFSGNGVVCKEITRHPGEFLLLNQGMATLRVPFHPTPNDAGRPIAIQYFQTLIGIDVDCGEGRVYWSDLTGKNIKSSKYDGSNILDLITSDMGSPEGISIDWVSRNIYWTDSSKDTIEVANVDTKLRKVLIDNGLVNPRGIAVHPAFGKVFWSDWNRDAPKIEWANLDGTNRGIFLDGPNIKLPNSLAIDWDQEELCWADAGTKSIECVGLYNNKRRIVVANCSYPFGLAISRDNYYWTDWDTKKVESARKPSGARNKPITIPLESSGKPYGIVAVPSQCQRMSNACQYENGHCGENRLCLPNSSGGRSCVCADADDDGSGQSSDCNDIV